MSREWLSNHGPVRVHVSLPYRYQYPAHARVWSVCQTKSILDVLEVSVLAFDESFRRMWRFSATGVCGSISQPLERDC